MNRDPQPLDLESLSLREQGFTLPAEWEPHAGTWLAWPHNVETWGPKARLVPAIWARMARELCEGEAVNFLVNDSEMLAWAQRVLKEAKADASNVRLHLIESNDAWIRDFGPTFVKSRREGTVLGVDWVYNCWGGKYPPYDDDARAAQRICEAAGIPAVSCDLVAEGGALEVNGAGTLLTTIECLPNSNRNPGLSREDIEQRLRDFLGVSNILWLTGGVEGDDTDSHVDEIARFLSPTAIAVTTDPDASDRHAPLLARNFEAMRDLRDQDGRPFDLIEFPMPPPIRCEGVRLPASYSNFYVGNGAVLVPSFNCTKRDDFAAGTLRDFFPDRRIVPIPASDIIWGLGAFHCVTQQQPL